MKRHAVVIVVQGQKHKAVDRLGRNLGIQLHGHFTFGGLEHHPVRFGRVNYPFGRVKLEHSRARERLQLDKLGRVLLDGYGCYRSRRSLGQGARGERGCSGQQGQGENVTHGSILNGPRAFELTGSLTLESDKMSGEHCASG